MGKRDEDLLPAPIADVVAAADRRVIEEGVEISQEEEIPMHAELRTYLTAKFPLPDENGVPYALCGISTDITDRKRKEADLREQLGASARSTISGPGSAHSPICETSRSNT